MDLFWIYAICLGVGLIFTIISAFMADVFGGHDVHVDVGGHGADGHAEAGLGTQDMPGFSPLSPTTVASFVTAFGGFGMILSRIEATNVWYISVPLSAIGGLGVSAGVFWLFAIIFRKTQGSSESRVALLIGVQATVITPIGENAVGEIAYVQGGSRYTAPARAESPAPIASGRTVKITRIVGTQFFVTPL